MESPREILIDSLEAFSIRCHVSGYEEDPARIPVDWLEEYEALWGGTAVLRLPDGSRWISSWSLPAERDKDRATSRYILDHTVLHPHAGSSEPPEMFLNADTLDTRRAYCSECRKFFDLESEWLEAEATREPWPEPVDTEEGRIDTDDEK